MQAAGFGAIARRTFYSAGKATLQPFFCGPAAAGPVPELVPASFA